MWMILLVIKYDTQLFQFYDENLWVFFDFTPALEVLSWFMSIIILTAWIRKAIKRTLMKTTVLWDVTSCSLIEPYQLFRETCSLHYQGRRVSCV
jgi:hypothetical protein